MAEVVEREHARRVVVTKLAPGKGEEVVRWHGFGADKDEDEGLRRCDTVYSGMA